MFCVLSQYLCIYININILTFILLTLTYITSICVENFTKRNVNFFSQMYNWSGNIKNWTQFKNIYDLNDNFHFKCVQLPHSIPRELKSIFKQNIIIHDLLVLDHHLICRSWLVNVEKFSSKELYGILILLRSNISTSQDYFNNKFANQHLN